MKNHEGIEIVPGQVWRDVAGEKFEVIALDGEKVVYKFRNSYYGSEPTKGLFTTLIKTSDGCDLEESRREGWHVWVPDMQLPEGKITECEHWSEVWWYEDGNTSKWSDEPRRYKLKPVSPEYRLFEIDWSTAFPRIENLNSCATIGLRTKDNYRIFGFIDNPEWTISNGFNRYPCDHEGNRKYAIGRLENER